MIEIIQSDVFVTWLRKLRDRKLLTIITDRLLRVSEGNMGDVKPVGEGIGEMRIHYGAGYRLYFIQRGDRIIIMLAGGDKSTQERDIKIARKLAQEWR